VIPPSALSRAVFESGKGQRYRAVDSTAFVFDDGPTAQRFVDLARTNRTRCNHYTSVYGPVSFEEVTAPAFGDASDALRYTVQGRTYDLVTARVGNIVTQITAVGLTPAELQRDMQRAVTKATQVSHP
jgi:hypothetical protein